MPIGDVWRVLLETPLTNLMVGLAALFGGSFGLSIIAFTLITRALTFPLTLRSLRASRKLQELQPRLKDLQKQHRDSKARAEAQRQLFKEHGVNPVGCLGPQLIQWPIFVAMNRVVRASVTSSPDALANLSHRLYPLGALQRALPLNPHFLGMDLGRPHNVALTGAVFGLMLLQQRLSVATRVSSTSETSTVVAYFTPGLFAFFVLAVPAGVGLYWAISTLVGIVLQEAFLYRGERRWASVFPQRLLGSALPIPSPGLSADAAGAAGPASPLDVPSPANEPRARRRRSRRSRRRRG